MLDKHNKPFLVIDPNEYVGKNVEEIIRWLKKSKIEKLNVAGPRENDAPGIREKTQNLISVLIESICHEKSPEYFLE